MLISNAAIQMFSDARINLADVNLIISVVTKEIQITFLSGFMISYTRNIFTTMKSKASLKRRTMRSNN